MDSSAYTALFVSMQMVAKEMLVGASGMVTSSVSSVVSTVIVCVVCVGAAKYNAKAKKLLKRLQLPYLKPEPFVGSFRQFIDKPFGEVDLANRKQNGPVYAAMEGSHVTIVMHDLNMIKEVFTRRIDEFPGRRKIPLKGQFQASMYEQVHENFKRHHAILSPAFSAHGVRNSFPYLRDCMRTCLQNMTSLSDEETAFEVKSQLTGPYTMDCIAMSAFGVHVGAQSNPNDPFVAMGRKLSDLEPKNPFILASFIFESLAKPLEWMGYDSFPPGLQDFFITAAREAIRKRREANCCRNDYLGAMIRAMEKDGSMTEEEVAANALLVFMAGYDGTSSTLAFLLYHLAKYPEYQERLLNEILTELPEDPQYDDYNQLPFLDQCIKETLRLYPTMMRVERCAERDVTVGGQFIPRGTVCVAPIWALHHNEEHFPNAEMFQPERFASPQQPAFLAWGLGQRHCLGLRLAQLQMRLCITELLKAYKFHLDDRHHGEASVQLKPGFFSIPRAGIWLRATRRQ